MTEDVQRCFEAAFRYAWGLYGGNRPSSNKEEVRRLAAAYAQETVARYSSASASERIRIMDEHRPKTTTTTQGPHYR